MAGTIPFRLHFDEFAQEDRVVVVAVLAVHLLLAAVLGDYRRVALRERAAELEHRGVLATARERERIARELHDIVGHALAVVITQADGGRYGARSDPAAAAAALETIAATARQALAETRRTVGTLGEAPREPVPGAGELRALVAPHARRRAGRPARTSRAARPRSRRARSLTVYRVVQEALTNVLKHAGRGANATSRCTWRGRRGDARRARRWWYAVLAVRRRPRAERHAGAGRAVRRDGQRGAAPGGGGYELRATIPVGAETRRGVFLVYDQALVRAGL